MIASSLFIMAFPGKDDSDDGDDDADDDAVEVLPWTFYVAVALPCVLGISDVYILYWHRPLLEQKI